MKTWNEYCEQVGLTKFIKNGPPEVNEIWYAYRKGEVIICSTADEARMVSNLFDYGVDRIEYNKYIEHVKLLEKQAAANWKTDLRIESGNMPKRVFDVLFKKAYDTFNTKNFDNILKMFIELRDLYNDIKEARMWIDD